TISQDIFREYWIGHSLSHPNLVSSHSLSCDGDDKAWVMQMEYVPFPLLDLLDHDIWLERRWSLEATTCFFRQLVEAVAYMHSNGLAHRDLKVENIMVTDDGVVKLIDFGSATPSRDISVSDTICPANNWVGTPITMAPEAHYERFYDMEAADVWSLGIIFVRLYLGIHPW
ncbi:kinase-like domain-containing protein, partial [Clohesyomyces aquaticus]